jgi:SAM-dependent methyltransferase
MHSRLLNTVATYGVARIRWKLNISTVKWSLQKCRANASFRGIIYVLDRLLGGRQDVPLRKWPRRKHIFGVGMSDWPGYANLLEKKFNHENTFSDRKPQLDIRNLNKTHLEKYDFVISTDVFEHILSPVQQGFDNLLRLLKPEGYLVFSVPYICISQTLEHYPGLFEYAILDFHGGKNCQPR